MRTPGRSRYRWHRRHLRSRLPPHSTRLRHRACPGRTAGARPEGFLRTSPSHRRRSGVLPAGQSATAGMVVLRDALGMVTAVPVTRVTPDTVPVGPVAPVSPFGPGSPWRRRDRSRQEVREPCCRRRRDLPGRSGPSSGVALRAVGAGRTGGALRTRCAVGAVRAIGTVRPLGRWTRCAVRTGGAGRTLRASRTPRTVESVETVQSVGPVLPCGPCGPAAPCSASRALRPVAPVTPAGPVTPCGPIGPASPCAPVAPLAPFSAVGAGCALRAHRPALALRAGRTLRASIALRASRTLRRQRQPCGARPCPVRHQRRLHRLRPAGQSARHRPAHP